MLDLPTPVLHDDYNGPLRVTIARLDTGVVIDTIEVLDYAVITTDDSYVSAVQRNGTSVRITIGSRKADTRKSNGH